MPISSHSTKNSNLNWETNRDESNSISNTIQTFSTKKIKKGVLEDEIFIKSPIISFPDRICGDYVNFTNNNNKDLNIIVPNCENKNVCSNIINEAYNKTSNSLEDFKAYNNDLFQNFKNVNFTDNFNLEPNKNYDGKNKNKHNCKNLFANSNEQIQSINQDNQAYFEPYFKGELNKNRIILQENENELENNFQMERSNLLLTETKNPIFNEIIMSKSKTPINPLEYSHFQSIERINKNQNQFRNKKGFFTNMLENIFNSNDNKFEKTNESNQYPFKMYSNDFSDNIIERTKSPDSYFYRKSHRNNSSFNSNFTIVNRKLQFSVEKILHSNYKQYLRGSECNSTINNYNISNKHFLEEKYSKSSERCLKKKITKIFDFGIYYNEIKEEDKLNHITDCTRDSIFKFNEKVEALNKNDFNYLLKGIENPPLKNFNENFGSQIMARKCYQKNKKKNKKINLNACAEIETKNIHSIFEIEKCLKNPIKCKPSINSLKKLKGKLEKNKINKNNKIDQFEIEIFDSNAVCEKSSEKTFDKNAKELEKIEKVFEDFENSSFIFKNPYNNKNHVNLNSVKANQSSKKSKQAKFLNKKRFSQEKFIKITNPKNNHKSKKQKLLKLDYIDKSEDQTENIRIDNFFIDLQEYDYKFLNTNSMESKFGTKSNIQTILENNNKNKYEIIQNSNTNKNINNNSNSPSMRFMEIPLKFLIGKRKFRENNIKSINHKPLKFYNITDKNEGELNNHSILNTNLIFKNPLRRKIENINEDKAFKKPKNSSISESKFYKISNTFYSTPTKNKILINPYDKDFDSELTNQEYFYKSLKKENSVKNYCLNEFSSTFKFDNIISNIYNGHNQNRNILEFESNKKLEISPNKIILDNQYINETFPSLIFTPKKSCNNCSNENWISKSNIFRTNDSINKYSLINTNHLEDFFDKIKNQYKIEIEDSLNKDNAINNYFNVENQEKLEFWTLIKDLFCEENFYEDSESLKKKFNRYKNLTAEGNQFLKSLFIEKLHFGEFIGIY